MNKAPESIPEPMDSGHSVVLDDEQSYVESKDERRTALRRQNGMWHFDRWRLPKEMIDDPRKISKLFQRQG